MRSRSPRALAAALASLAALAACAGDVRTGALTAPGSGALPRVGTRALPADLPPTIAASLADAAAAGLHACGTSPDLPGANFSRAVNPGAAARGASFSIAQFGGFAAGPLLTSTTGFPLFDLTAANNRLTFPTGANDAGQVVGANLNADAVNYTAVVWTAAAGYTAIAPLGGDVTSYALGNDNAGRVVGYSRGPTGATRAFLWQGGSASDLGAAFGGDSTVAYDISDNGVIVGHGKAAGVPTPFRYQGGAFTTLGLPAGLTRAYGTAVSGDGLVLAGWGTTSANSSRPWRWTGGAYEVATLPAGVTQARGFGVNKAGDVVGFAVTSTGIRGFYWPAGGALTLTGTLPGGGESRLWAVNDAGMAVGYARSQADGFLAIRYSLAGGIVNLGKQQGACSSYGYAITTDGDVAGNNDVSQVLNASVWPVPTAGLPPVTQSEGSAVTFTANVQGLCTAGTVTYRWNFGDGSPVVETTTPTVSHTYADNRPSNAPYPVTLTATDGCGNTTTVTSTATIVNLPPVPTVSPVKPALACMELGQVTWGFTDAGALDAAWSYTIAWGDGASSQGSVTAQGGPFTSPTHSYATSGTYTVALTVTDKDGASATATTQIVYECAPRFSLGDLVWNDANDNGQRDDGEGGIGGVVLSVTGPNGFATTVTTAPDGSYTLGDLLAGSYTVCAGDANRATGGALAGFVPTYDLDGLTTPNCATASVGPSRTDVDFGYRVPARGSIGNRVWLDTDGDGAQQGGEPGVQGVTVTITGPNGFTATRTTGPDGLYTFPDLPAGSYTVCVGAANLTAGAALAGTTPSGDLDGTTTPNCAVVTLAEGQDRTDADFGYAPPRFTLGDRVWNDLDGDGQQDADEPGLVGVTVTLRTAGGQTVGTATTGANGAYSFTGLLAGSYTACVTGGLPAGMVQTFDLDGLGTANCATASVGPSRTDVDFGYRVPPAPPATGQIGNYTWIDANGNGRQDVGEPALGGVRLTLGGSATGTQTSTSAGAYLFTGLPAGTFSVSATAPAGFVFTTANAAGVAAGSNSNASPSTVVFPTSSGSDLTIDFGFVPTAGAGQGCTPGYWRQSQHFGSWRWYGQSDRVDVVFGVTRNASQTLLDAVSAGGNSNGSQMFRHGTAALLNAVYQSGVSYPFTAPQVIAMVRDAWNSGSATRWSTVQNQLAAANEAGCPLGRNP